MKSDDLLLKNDDFRSKNDDLLLKNDNILLKNGRLFCDLRYTDVEKNNVPLKTAGPTTQMIGDPKLCR